MYFFGMYILLIIITNNNNNNLVIIFGIFKYTFIVYFRTINITYC